MDESAIPILLSEENVAALLGRTEGTIRNWRSQGRGPQWVANPDNGQFMGYRREAVEEWLLGATEGVS